MSLFLRLLEDKDKGAALAAAVQSVTAGEANARVFDVEPASFEQVPGAPFAYWTTERIRSLFGIFPPFNSTERYAQHGGSSKDDFRYLRLYWELLVTEFPNRWITFAKGGSYSPFYADVYLTINWYRDAYELEADLLKKYPYLGKNANWVLHRECNYFHPGLTWPLRTNGLSFRVMPAGCIFGHKGPAAFVKDDDPTTLLALCAVLNSAAFKQLVALQLARTELAQSYEVGLIQQTPVPDIPFSDTNHLADLAHRAWSLKRGLDTAELTSHAFILPALMQSDQPTLPDRAMAWTARVAETETALSRIQSEIDERCFDLYDFDAADRAAARGIGLTTQTETNPGDEDDSEPAATPHLDPKDLAAELFDWLVGVAFGRFDLRLATGEREALPEPEPFDPLPLCSTGMLTGADGLPLTAPPPAYPLHFPADGILVDDAGIDGKASAEADLPHRIQQAMGVIWGEDAARIEAELRQLLGVRRLRDWLRRASAYFADHLGRHSKSRRKAPLYWPLATESGNYTLWLYYPRLTDQTLYTCINDHIDPKLQEIERDFTRLRAIAQPDAKTRKQIDALVELQRELKTMREELLRVARLPYKPDQNDGVLITAAPLWRLFRHTPWRNALKTCWQELEAGKVDWAHLAYAIWPDRVREACKKDKSIAIAHGLEDLYENRS